ncbi:serine hydrolase [Flammeovirga sp. MY04]|uniref:serine hydrolase domain-containing protein n=1 Tax=Flammeovirga sp. MY04 TaxID=1191459 RepID=UPI000806288A|nr:serine hydrolase domain-containing protein [Flammeovirga sp. MY04]ANQ47607.1 serine hydrolase [Flammeovirga sp. MY04]
MRILIFFILSMTTAYGQVNQKDIHKFEKYVNKLLTDSQKAPVANIFCYIENDSLLVHKGFGHLNVKGDEVNKNSTFKIASITKMFTSTVILQMMEEDLIDLDAPVSRYLSDINYLQFDSLHLYQGKSYGNTITIRQLLQHRSGLGDIFIDTYETFVDHMKKHSQKEWTPEKLFEFYYKNEVNHMTHFQPDSGYYYTDVGYFLLGLTIEKVTKKSLAENYRERILDPLELTSTYFEYHEENPSKNKQASAYIGDWEITGNVNTSYDWGGGGLVSNTQDLSKFIHGLFDQKLFQKKETLEMMTEARSIGRKYGMGITTYSFNDRIYYGHGGFWGSLMAYDPIHNSTIILSINQVEPPFQEIKLIKKAVALVE